MYQKAAPDPSGAAFWLNSKGNKSLWVHHKLYNLHACALLCFDDVEAG